MAEISARSSVSLLRSSSVHLDPQSLQDYNNKASDDEPAMVPCLDIEA